MKFKKAILGFTACLFLAVEVSPANAQVHEKKNVSQAQLECEKAAREAPSCLPNNACAEQKLKETERWCIQWIRENTPPPLPATLNSTAMGMSTK